MAFMKRLVYSNGNIFVTDIRLPTSWLPTTDARSRQSARQRTYRAHCCPRINDEYTYFGVYVDSGAATTLYHGWRYSRVQR